MSGEKRMSEEIVLDENLLIGKGLHRKCYRHPDVPGLVVKVIHFSGNGSAEREAAREAAYYERLKKRLSDWRGIPKFFGSVSTNLGAGWVYEEITDFDGSPSRTLSERYSDPGGGGGSLQKSSLCWKTGSCRMKL